MESNEIFTISFTMDYTKHQQLVSNNDNYQLLMLENPYKKWYKILLEFLTLGFYKAPYQYKCKLINHDKQQIEDRN